MRSFNSRFVSPIVVLALLSGSLVGPAMARSAAGNGGGASSAGASSSGASGSVNLAVLRQVEPVRVKLQPKYDRCEYDSTGRLEFAPTGQPCPNTL
jgi:hypothetical protein